MMVEAYFTKQFIGGEWRTGRSSSSIKDINPYSGELLLTVPGASREDLNDAYAAAEKAQVEWEQTPMLTKQALFDRLLQTLVEQKEVIVQWLIKESGSTFQKANIEFEAAYGNVKESATFITRSVGNIRPSLFEGKENFIFRKPKGVVGIIGPWNFPFHLTIRSLAPAIALGNAAVIKPASDTPVTSGLLLGRIFELAGFPKGLVNVVVGRGSEIGDDFVAHPVPKLISFTGSTEVGSRVGELAGKHIKEVALELGGNNPFIVLPDADVQKAAKAAVFGKFNHNGQVCMAINRIIVHEAVYDVFIKEYASLVKNLKSGDPSHPDTNIGPLINESQVKRIQQDVHESLTMGARFLVYGTAKGCIMEPIVLTDVQLNMPIVQNEIFGPVACILKVGSEEEAIHAANDSIYGLTGAIFTKDLYHGMKVAKKLNAGMVHVNDSPISDEPHVPFGGEKSSGIGRFNAEWAIEKFTTVKWIGVQSGEAVFPF
ncbi:UNVERIFIED_CONTAM: acyl-CoA reductase-like NAD-dependent aldehyde dehydrogenase [Brevibacillus sp. OAP136]